MNRMLKHPATNAVCLGIFSAFYTALFWITSVNPGFKSMLYYAASEEPAGSFWFIWSSFLTAGNQKFLAVSLAALSTFVILLLVMRRKSYDEYHLQMLTHCLVVSFVLTLIAIALLFLTVITEPTGIIEKFMLFIVVQWATVVLADLVYVQLCKWR